MEMTFLLLIAKRDQRKFRESEFNTAIEKQINVPMLLLGEVSYFLKIL